MVFACEGISDRTAGVVIMDLDIGHMAPMMPVVTGAMAKAHVQGNTFVLDYEWR